jgi:hypothetical protein
MQPYRIKSFDAKLNEMIDSDRVACDRVACHKCD